MAESRPRESDPCYKAVIFDVGGVLISPPQKAIGEYEKYIKVSP